MYTFAFIRNIPFFLLYHYLSKKTEKRKPLRIPFHFIPLFGISKTHTSRLAECKEIKCKSYCRDTSR
ncbi:hypothetical protein CBR56_14995 [Bacillus thuringiensis]|nr:hypothetical protein BK728_27540 [Bacillus thuringiensis serovar chanpaisis]PNK27931.1 hypothetical protein CBR56_14995 [Bacillus thuringiensis]